MGPIKRLFANLYKYSNLDTQEILNKIYTLNVLTLILCPFMGTFSQAFTCNLFLLPVLTQI